MSSPRCYRGFTPDDIIHYAYYEHGRYGVCLDESYGREFPIFDNGILIGVNTLGHDHAVAYIAGRVHNPADGCIYSTINLKVQGMIVFR